MFDFFFYLNYRITTEFFKNKSYPVISTIAVVSFYQFFTLLFLVDFISYQVLGNINFVRDRQKIFGFILITLLFVLNYIYFNSNRRKKILVQFKKMDRNTKRRYNFLGVIFMIFVWVLTIFQAYSIKNNIHWW